MNKGALEVPHSTGVRPFQPSKYFFILSHLSTIFIILLSSHYKLFNVCFTFILISLSYNMIPIITTFMKRFQIWLNWIKISFFFKFYFDKQFISLIFKTKIYLPSTSNHVNASHGISLSKTNLR